MVLKNWMVAFSWMQLLNSLALLIVSIYDGVIPAFFALTVIGSVLKLVGVIYAPQSNTAFFFVLFYLALEVFLIISAEIRNHLFELIERSTADTKLAKQLAHDIRSPLSALRMLMGQVPWGESQAEVRTAAVLALEKMRLISREMLANRKTSIYGSSEIGIIEEVSTLKRTTQPKPILIQWNGVSRESRVPIHSESFFRIVDNLVSNAIEEEASDSVQIEVRSVGERIQIAFKNRSRSIEGEILRKISTHGGTFGKPDGNGLGLKFCRDQVLTAGGELELSCEGSLFAVTVQLPRVSDQVEMRTL